MKPRKLPAFPPWDFFFVLVVKILTLPDRFIVLEKKNFLFFKRDLFSLKLRYFFKQ